MKAQANRPHCQKPSACDAKGKGHCRRCHMAAAVKANWQDPEFRAKQAAATKANWQDPEFRARNVAAVKANWQDPEFRAKQAAAVKANWQDPEFRAKQAAATKAAKAGAKGVEIPKWVPVDLHDEYLEAAAWQGEEFAASHCRRLLRELRQHSEAYADQGACPAGSKSRAKAHAA